MNGHSQLQLLVEQVKSSFGTDLVCILLIGSAQHNHVTPFSDVDLVAVVKRFDIYKAKVLRERMRDSPILLDLSIITEDEIPADPDHFQIGTHGCYHLALVLRQAKCLFGTNILMNLADPTPSAVRDSVLRKVCEYTWWARRMYVEANRERSLESNYKLNSRLIKMVRDIWFLVSGSALSMAPLDLVSRLVNRSPDLFNPRDIDILRRIADPAFATACVSDMSEEFFKKPARSYQ